MPPLLRLVVEQKYVQLPLNRSTGELNTAATETIALSDGFVFDGELFNANGIEVIRCFHSERVDNRGMIKTKIDLDVSEHVPCEQSFGCRSSGYLGALQQLWYDEESLVDSD